MSRFIAEADRSRGTLLPESIDEYVSEDNFVDALDLAGLGCAGVEPKATGRPAYRPAGNTAAIKNVCGEFIVMCRRWQLFTEATVAIDGSKSEFRSPGRRSRTSGRLEVLPRHEPLDGARLEDP
jgi:hypothetical protein